MRTSRAVKSVVGSILLTGAVVALLSGCGSIRTEPLPSADVKLSCNPPKIYVAPFDIENARMLVDRQGRWDSGRGEEYFEFKKTLQRDFQQFLVERLQKIAPTEMRWMDDLPDEGWLVGGQFTTVFQGSRFLRSVVGFGVGDTTFQTTVYVYDLSKSKTHYLLAFRTGVPDSLGEGKGSGMGPGLIVNAPYQMGSGFRLDMSRTAREIRNVLMKYAHATPMSPPAPAPEPQKKVVRVQYKPEPKEEIKVEEPKVKPIRRVEIEEPATPIDRPTYNPSDESSTFRSRKLER